MGRRGHFEGGLSGKGVVKWEAYEKDVDFIGGGPETLFFWILNQIWGS